MNCFEDVYDVKFAFQSLYTSILDKHTPLKSVHVQGNQVPFGNGRHGEKQSDIIITFGEPVCDAVLMQITQPISPRETFKYFAETQGNKGVFLENIG